MRNNPCSPGLLFKQNGTIFSFCFYYSRSYMGIALVRVVLHRNFDVSFILPFESLNSGHRINITNFLQFKYNNHFMIVYGIGRTLYAVVPQTTAITTNKTNLFLVLGRDQSGVAKVRSPRGCCICRKAVPQP